MDAEEFRIDIQIDLACDRSEVVALAETITRTIARYHCETTPEIMGIYDLEGEAI